jgi:hypothetical protein
VSFIAGPTIIYQGSVTGLTVRGGKVSGKFGEDTFNINSSQAGTPVLVFAGNCQNVVTVGQGLLAGIGAQVSISGALPTALALRIDDSKDSTHNATLTGNSVTFAGLPAISYSSTVSSLDVVGGSGLSAITVNSVSATTPVTIWNGAYDILTGPAKSKVVLMPGLPVWA